MIKKRAAALVALLILAGCPGPPPPPQRDLFSAVARSADTADMWQYAIEASIEITRPSGTVWHRASLTGAARNSESFRGTVSSDPVISGVTTPVLEEIPGAVRPPGEALWFSGTSGAMIPFGKVAEVLPPLGRPDTVLRRIPPMVAKSVSALGTHEIRGHLSDGYAFPLVDRPLKSVPLTPSAQPSSGPDGLAEAVSVFMANLTGRQAGREPPIGSVVKSDATAWVDQIDDRLRRWTVRLEAVEAGHQVALLAQLDVWGYDPAGNYHEPVDTTFVGPEQQELINDSSFPILYPISPPTGMSFVELTYSGGNCPVAGVSMTGRGRDGFIGMRQTPARCQLPPRGRSVHQTTPSPSPSPVQSPPLPSPTLTQTLSGESVSIVTLPDDLQAEVEKFGTRVEITARNGVGTSELIKTVEWLRPLRVPIPPALSRPLPAVGPERR